MQDDDTTYPYRARLGVNWSTLTAMRISPAHYRHLLTHPRTDTPAMALGRLVHTMVLEPERVAERYAIWTGGRRGTNEHKAWLAAHAEQEAVTSSEYGTAAVMAMAVGAHREARRVLRGGRVEMTLRWVDPRTRVRCKGRGDHVRGAALTDLKVMRSIDLHDVRRTLAQMAYHGQLAFYQRGVFARVGRLGPLRIVAVESEPPHDVAVFRLSDETLAAGHDLVDTLLDRLVECRRRRRWPGRYDGFEQELDLPGWALPAEEVYGRSGEIEVLSN